MKLKGQALIQWLVSLEEQRQDSSELSPHSCTQKRSHENTGRGPPSVSQTDKVLSETNPAGTSILDLYPPEVWEHKFLLLKLLNLWYFI